MCSFQLMKIGQKVLGKKLFAALMKQTFYGQFVGGEVRYFPTSTISLFSLSLLERPDHRPHHRQNEELRSEEHPGLQRRGGPLPGGRREHRDGVSISGDEMSRDLTRPIYSSCVSNSHVDEQNPNFAGLNIADRDKEFTGKIFFIIIISTSSMYRKYFNNKFMYF